MDLKGFYRIAKKELEQLYDGEPLDFRLEQVEPAKDFNYAKIVVSYLVESKNKPEIVHFKYERIYKLLEINDQEEVVSFRIFE